MKKARIISHLTELDNIRKDEYMPEEVIDKVIDLEKLLTRILAEELEKPLHKGFRGDSTTSKDSRTNTAPD